MLKSQHETFARLIVEGKTQTDAYRSAYPNNRCMDKTIHEKASRLAADERIIARIAELRAQLEDSTIMTAKERLKWLTEIIRSDEETTTDKLRASDQMNKMQGEYVQKIEADVKGEIDINIELTDD